MSIRTTRAQLATATIGTALAGVLALGASPASAASGGIVNGSGTVTTDWHDEGTLSSSKYAKSNATCLWQRILYSEGVDRASGTPTDFADGDIDGVFGSRTTYASKQLQKRWGLGADGLIGPKTWAKANTKLKFVSGSTAPGRTLVLKYVGKKNTFKVVRNTKGNYEFSQDGGARVASYKYRSCK
jgi:peptidoglycan hydrolase-like protein with peptidoglycan-binding domain